MGVTVTVAVKPVVLVAVGVVVAVNPVVEVFVGVGVALSVGVGPMLT